MTASYELLREIMELDFISNLSFTGNKKGICSLSAASYVDVSFLRKAASELVSVVLRSLNLRFIFNAPSDF